MEDRRELRHGREREERAEARAVRPDWSGVVCEKGHGGLLCPVVTEGQ